MTEVAMPDGKENFDQMKEAHEPKSTVVGYYRLLKGHNAEPTAAAFARLSHAPANPEQNTPPPKDGRKPAK